MLCFRKLERLGLAGKGSIAIIGSVNRGDNQTQAAARAAAYQLGAALARKDQRIVVYSDEPRFLEVEVVHGYMDGGSAAEGSIEVRYPEKLDDKGKPEPPPFNSHFNNPRFLFLPDKSRDWEVSYYTSLEDVRGILLLQGGRSALVAGVIGLGYRKPIVACSGFGGAAIEVLNMALERNLLVAGEKALLQSNPGASDIKKWADACVDLFEVQSNRLAQQRASELLAAKSLKRQLNQHTFAALAAFVIALSLWVLNWDNRGHVSPSVVAAFLLASSALAGAAGAMLWIILPYLKGRPPAGVGNLWGTWGLGLLAGLITAALFVLGQDHVFPDLNSYMKGPEIEEIKAGFLAKLIPASMISSLVSGITLDRAIARLAHRKSEAGA
jgi:hypothetical protein